MDRIVQRQLLNWARRTHPNKGPGWLKRKYFNLAGPGTFAIRQRDATGQNRVVSLHRISRTAIERHIKVRGEANPCDPVHTEYFERRRYSLWRVMSRGKARGKAGQSSPNGVENRSDAYVIPNDCRDALDRGVLRKA